MTNGVTKKDSGKPGKTVAIIGGVHGNETVGVDAMRAARDTITPEHGIIYFIEGNPAAVEKNVRFVEKNLNRCFLEPGDDSLEGRRARELMPILDACDAMLDLHASNSEDATPFVICEDRGLPFARTLDFPIISTGWDALEPGATDGYVNKRGKLGICLECGSVHRPQETLLLAKESILRFLRYLGILDGAVSDSAVTHRFIHVHTVAHKGELPVTFSRDYGDFEALAPGEVFAKEGEQAHTAGAHDCIIFPRPNAVPGAELFILGEESPAA